MNGMIDASLLSVTICGNVQSGSLIRYVAGPEQAGVVDRSLTRSLPVHTKTQLGMWDVGHALAVCLSAVHVQTAVDLGQGMAACVVLEAGD